MYKKEKMLGYIKSDMMFMFFLELGLLLMNMVFMPSSYFVVSKLLIIFLMIIMLFGVYYANKESKLAGIICLISGILFVLSFSLINFFLGIFMIIHSIAFLVTYDEIYGKKVLNE